MGRLVRLQPELGLGDLAVSVAVLVGEHVVDDAVGVEARGQTTSALRHLSHDVVCELPWKKTKNEVTQGQTFFIYVTFFNKLRTLSRMLVQ